jgi:hypothetical protein
MKSALPHFFGSNPVPSILASTLLLVLPACTSPPRTGGGDWSSARMMAAVGGSELQVDRLFSSSNPDLNGYSAVEAGVEFAPGSGRNSMLTTFRYQDWESDGDKVYSLALGLMLREYLETVDTQSLNPFFSVGADLGIIGGDASGVSALFRPKAEVGIRSWLARDLYYDLALEVGIDLGAGALVDLYGVEYGVIMGFGVQF